MVGAGVGAGVGVGAAVGGTGADGDSAQASGAHRLEVVDYVADELVDLEPDLTEDVDVVVTEDGTTAGFEYQSEYEYEDPVSDVDVDVEDLELSVDVEDLELEAESELEAEPESESEEAESEEAMSDVGLAGQSRIAGEYVYQDYVDYENDVEYKFVVHEDGTDEAEEAEGDVELEAPVADADVKRKGGGRKGRGVAASSSSR
jgi:hypothetical protein